MIVYFSGRASVIRLALGTRPVRELAARVAAPLTAGPRPSRAFLGLAGLIGGGPIFLGTLFGDGVRSEPAFCSPRPLPSAPSSMSLPSC